MQTNHVIEGTRRITLELDEDLVFRLRLLMGDLFKLSQKGASSIRIGSGDLSTAEEMLKVIPEDVRPYYPEWLRDMKIELVIDEKSVNMFHEEKERDKDDT